MNQYIFRCMVDCPVQAPNDIAAWNKMVDKMIDYKPGARVGGILYEVRSVVLLRITPEGLTPTSVTYEMPVLAGMCHTMWEEARKAEAGK